MSALSLNIGGSHFLLLVQNLEKYPFSRLAKFCKLTHSERISNCDAFLHSKGEYFFDRSAFLFDCVAQIYRTDECYEPLTVLCSTRAVRTELIFWGFDPTLFMRTDDNSDKNDLFCYAKTVSRDDSGLSLNNLPPILEPQHQGRFQVSKVQDPMKKLSTITNVSWSDPVFANDHTAVPIPDASSQSFSVTNNSESAIGYSLQRFLMSSEKDSSETTTMTPVHFHDVIEEVSDDRYTCKCCIPRRKKLEHFLEEPKSSVYATAYMIVTLIFVFITFAVLVLDSLPEFAGDCADVVVSNSLSGSTDNTLVIMDLVNDSSTTEHQNVSEAVHDALIMCSPTNVKVRRALSGFDIACVIWFTIDYVLRLAAAPQIWRFVTRPLSLVDIIAIVPFYVQLVLELTVNTHALRGVRQALLVQRTFRIGRILKVARYSLGVRVIGETLIRSRRELGFLLIYWFMLVTFFSTVLYYIEKDVPGTGFISIPASAWWAAVTFSTTGYGDMVPQTVWGKIVASVATLISIVLVGFPVSVLVDNFRRIYNEMADFTTRRALRNWRRLYRKLSIKHGLSIKSNGKSRREKRLPKLSFQLNNQNSQRTIRSRMHNVRRRAMS